MKKRNLSIGGSASGRKTFCILHSAFYVSGGGSAAAGFTLIEILVALVVVAITVSVALESQITSLKIEQKARSLQVFRFETERIFSASRLAKNEQELAQFLVTNSICRVKSEKVQVESGTNVLTFLKYELSADDLPAFSSVSYTLFPAGKTDSGTSPPGKQ